MLLNHRPDKGQKLYFMGIAGTGMASVAGLMQEAGYQIVGSDKGVYPPMSLMLDALKIPVLSPYCQLNLEREKPDVVVVANCLSRGNPEIEYMLEKGMTYTSFPALMAHTCLKSSKNIVVAGTHGKTTTASLLSWCLKQLHLDPGYFIGGVPGNFQRSFSSGDGSWFVLEGDEYDTAFFDKGSKFLHYRPEYLILNNLEFDHADIFRGIEDIEKGFAALIEQIKNPRHIVANLSDQGVKDLIEKLGILDQVSGVCTSRDNHDSRAFLKLTSFDFDRTTRQWRGTLYHHRYGVQNFSSNLGGPHNGANIAQVAGTLSLLAEEGHLDADSLWQNFSAILNGFQGVRRRQDLLGVHHNISIFEDFAHHPTAVSNVLKGLRQSHPKARIVAAFEPANATSRRNTFTEAYSKAFKGADVALIAPVKEDKRIPEAQRMNTKELAKLSGSHAQAFSDYEQMSQWLGDNCCPGDVVIFMSSGSFAGIPKKFCQRLKETPPTT